MKKKYFLVFLYIAILSFASCRGAEISPTATPIPPARETPTPTSPSITAEPVEEKAVFADITDFESGINAYEYGFANYPEGKETDSNLFGSIETIPGHSSKGMLMSGVNQSTSLIMYISKNIVALPNAEYSVTIDFDIAANIKSQIQTHETTAKNVYIKSGVNNISFMSILDSENYYGSNWDIGNLQTDGPDGITLGTAEKINSSDDSFQYKHFSKSFQVMTTEEGLICVLIAAQSNMPDLVSIYFDNIVIEIAEQ